MIKPAILYENELKELFYSTWFDSKYDYYNYGIYHPEFKAEREDWSKHQFAIVDNRDNVIGYIGYSIDRPLNAVYGLQIINFSDNILVFGADLKRILVNIFEKYNFNKINFSAAIDNPISKKYDRIIERYGGRVVGYKKDEAITNDGELHDVKIYEITRKDYYGII